MDAKLIPIPMLLVPLLAMAILLAYALYKIYRIPTLRTIEDIVRNDSWGNLGTLSPTPEPFHDLESGLRTPEPARLGTVWNFRRNRPSVELLRFQIPSPYQISFIHNNLSPLAKISFQQYAPLINLVDTPQDH
jgi:hypothetical protein